MTSKQKRKIARTNGAKAAGTKSPEGIAKSAMNSLQHGLNSMALVLSNESLEKFHELLQTYIDNFQPQNGVEMKLVEEMVAAKWRQQRIWVIQTTAMDLEMDSQLVEFQEHEKGTGRPLHLKQSSRVTLAFTALANKEKTLELLLRYETSFARMHDRAMKTLHRLREESKLQNDPEPHEVAVQPPCETGSESETVRPQPEPAQLAQPKFPPPHHAATPTVVSAIPNQETSPNRGANLPLNPSKGSTCGPQLLPDRNLATPSQFK